MILPPSPLSPRAVMHRILPLCFLVSCGVFGLSSEDRDQLTSYKQRAAIYYDTGDLGKAIDQVQKGLVIDGDDYSLTQIWAWSLLRLSGNNDARLQQSRRHFEKLMDLRSMGQQSHQALLGYGLCLERIGQKERQQRDLLRGRLDTALEPMDRAEIEARASEHEALAASNFRASRTVLLRLIENGQEILLANKALMEVNSLLPDYDSALAHGEAYLAESKRLQAHWRSEIQLTQEVGYEKEARTRLSRLRNDEIEVRALLANIHAKAQNWAGVVGQLDVVLQMDPKRSIDYFNRGDSLRQLGRIAEMKEDFGNFLSLTNLPAGDPRVIQAVQAIRGNQDH